MPRPTSPWRRVGLADALALAALAVLAVAVRLVPWLRGARPYNIDGYPLLVLIEDFMERGAWVIERDGPHLIEYNSLLPAFTAHFAAVLTMAGLPPEAVGLVLPVVAVGAVLALYGLALRLTGSRLVALAAGAFLALYGTFVYFGAAIMKEGLALVLLPALVWWWLDRDDPRKRLLALGTILALGLMHHLTFLIALLTLGLLACYEASVRWQGDRPTIGRTLLDMLTLTLGAGGVIIYFQRVRMPFFTEVAHIEDIILLASICVVLALIGLRALGRPAGNPRAIKVGWTGIAFVTFVATVFIATYTFDAFSTLRIRAALLLFVPSYVLLILALGLGIQVVTQSRPADRPLLLALIHGPAAVIFFALLRGFDAFGFSLLSRALDFLDLALALGLAIGFGFLVWRVKDLRFAKPLQVGLVLVVLLLSASFLPMAYGIEDNFGIQDHTDLSQLALYSWAVTHYGGELGGEQRSQDIIEPIHDREVDPLVPWRLLYGENIAPTTHLVMVEERWGQDGAQMFPAARAELPDRVLADFLAGNSTVYHSDAPGNAKWAVWLP